MPMNERNTWLPAAIARSRTSRSCSHSAAGNASASRRRIVSGTVSSMS
jgi:hypothetical protein